MIAPEVLWHSLDRFAAERPNKLALSDEEGSISYADLPAEIHRALGIQPFAEPVTLPGATQ